jgi:hypothetical protein
MYIVPIAWIYVVLMMAVAEASNTNGTVLGAIVTFILYGVIPVSLVVYLMGAPARRRAIKAQEAAELAGAASTPPDASSHAASDPVATVREKP